VICYCCGREIHVARKVRVRRLTDLSEPSSKDRPAALAVVEQNTYRWGVVCPPCYLCLDNEVGGQIPAESPIKLSCDSVFRVKLRRIEPRGLADGAGFFAVL